MKKGRVTGWVRIWTHAIEHTKAGPQALGEPILKS